MPVRLFCLLSLSLACALTAGTARAGDWARFRGPNGDGVSPDGNSAPVEWSETKNLKWKLELPGPGHSCPIVVGDRAFVTCWTGYGVDRENPGEQADLKRHLLCIDRSTGKVRWDKAIAADLPEDRYGGMFAEHGYATHTPVSDGERVYAFFGKSGVFAFDMEGNQLWNKRVGTNLDSRRWGSSSSPILYDDLVIVTASVESHSLVALNRETGEEVWRAEAEGFGSTWGTPVIVKAENNRSDVVLAVPYEIWGFNPETGKLRWFCEAIGSNSMCASAIAHGGIVYAAESGPGGGGSIAVRVGGHIEDKDITETNVIWTGRDRSRIGTPVFHNDRLYWISGRVANCIDAKTGERIYQERLSGRTPSSNREQDNGGGGGRGFGGRGGGPGGQDYSSPVVADGKMYYACRNGDIYVIELGDEFKQLAMNRFEGDGGDFSSTPAISDGELFIRSTKNLYCVAEDEG